MKLSRLMLIALTCITFTMQNVIATNGEPKKIGTKTYKGGKAKKPKRQKHPMSFRESKPTAEKSATGTASRHAKTESATGKVETAKATASTGTVGKTTSISTD